MNEHPYGWLSLLPPFVAIMLAVVTRRIVLSLITGIFAGALLMANGDVLTAINRTWETHLWNTLIDPEKLRVFSFTLLMGAMIGVITRSGGMRGLIDLVSPWANNRRRGQFATWILGLLIFFDDYANTILLGSTLRPICDRLKISREKLAYLVDSTAAPVAGIALVSTWVAVEIDFIANGLEAVPGSELSPFGLFLSSIPYRFYVLVALCLVPMTALLGRDFGSMLVAERLTAAGEKSAGRIEVVGDNAQEKVSGWHHAVLPIGLTLSLVIWFIYGTGCQSICTTKANNAAEIALSAARESNEPEEIRRSADSVRDIATSGNIFETTTAIEALGRQLNNVVPSDDVDAETFSPTIRLRDIVGAADSSLALQYGALAGLCLAMLMARLQRLMKFDELVSSALAGARVVLPAVAILWTASSMSRMTTDISVDGEKSDTAYAFKDHRIYTAAFLTDMISGDEASQLAGKEPKLSAKFLPTVVFVLAAIVSFCTGTSWGTMGILVPVVVQAAYAIVARDVGVVSSNHPILVGSIAGVLAGAIFGDHCSPISDTTVLSSQATGCDHLAHVWTQMPYALTAAGISIVLGTLPIGFGFSVWLLLPAQLLALVVVLRVFGHRVEPA